MFIKLPHVLYSFPLPHAYNQNYPRPCFYKRKLPHVQQKKKIEEPHCTRKARVMRLVDIYI